MSLKKPTAGIILAAGESKRYGQVKQLVRLQGRYLLEWVLDAALHSELGHIVLVLGYEHLKIVQALGKKARHRRLTITINRHYKQGMSSSLQVGVLEIRDTFPSVMFLLGDQPFVDVETIDGLLHNFWQSDKDICVPFCRGKRSNPSIFSNKFYDQISEIEGDTGAKGIIQSYPGSVLAVQIENPFFPLDIDTAADVSKAKSYLFEKSLSHGVRNKQRQLREDNQNDDADDAGQ